MKRFISGVIIGALLFCSTGLWAEAPMATVADFKILLNGALFNPNPPAVVINGSTYLPLRVMSNALNIPITWNETLRQVEIGTAASPTGGGYHRSNPAPVGTPQTIQVSTYSADYKATVTVLEVQRGAAAWDTILSANVNNDAPDEGFEYILAKVSVKADLVSEDKAISVSKYDFDCFSSQSEEYASKSVTAPKPVLSGKIYTGGKAEGYIVLQVKISDSAPKLAYGLDRDGTGGIWFSLK